MHTPAKLLGADPKGMTAFCQKLAFDGLNQYLLDPIELPHRRLRRRL